MSNININAIDLSPITSMTDIGKQFQEKINEMGTLLDDRNSELEKCRHWKSQFVKLEREMISKNLKLDEYKKLLAKKEQFIDEKLTIYQKKSDHSVLSISNDFEASMEANMKYFQDLVQKCKNENINLKNLLKSNVEELASQKQKEVEMHEQLKNFSADQANLHGSNKHFTKRDEELTTQLETIKQHYNDLRKAHIAVTRKGTNEDMNTNELQNELRLYSRDLEVLMNEYDWLVGKHGYVTSQYDQLRVKNDDLRAATMSQLEEISVLRFKFDMISQKSTEQTDLNTKALVEYDALKQKYYILHNQYENLTLKLEEGPYVLDENEESIIDPQEYQNLHSQFLASNEESQKLRLKHVREAIAHGLTKEKHALLLEKVEDLQRKLNHRDDVIKNMEPNYEQKALHMKETNKFLNKSYASAKKSIHHLEIKIRNLEQSVRDHKNSLKSKHEEIAIINLRAQHALKQHNSTQEINKAIEKRYADLNDNHMKHLDSYADLDAKYNQSLSEVKKVKLQDTVYQALLAEWEVKYTQLFESNFQIQKDYSELQAEHKSSVRQFEEEYKRFKELIDDHKTMTKFIDECNETIISQKNENIHIVKKFELQSAELADKNLDIAELKKNEQKIIVDAKTNESSMEALLKESYSSAIKKLETELKCIKQVNKHLAKNPVEEIVSRSNRPEVNKLRNNLAIAQSKIETLKKENTRLTELANGHMNFSSLLENNMSVMASTNGEQSSFQAIITKLSNGLKKKEIALMKSELNVISHKNAYHRLQNKIYELEGQ